MSDFEKIHRDTISVYERNADGWDRQRQGSFYEKQWFEKFVDPLTAGSAILDVGCGAGEPISRFLVERGFSVTGVDSSAKMIELCKRRFPGETWIVADMRNLEMNVQFAGIVAWDSFFHLNPDEQRDTLQLFIQHLAPKGTLLLTVGHEAGEVLGTVEGEAVYHSSLAAEEYKRILWAGGLEDTTMIFQDESCGRRTVLMARR